MLANFAHRLQLELAETYTPSQAKTQPFIEGRPVLIRNDDIAYCVLNRASILQ